MCGIVGYTGSKQATPYLLEGLKTLEYRGYDSAGVIVEAPDGHFHGVKCAGRVSALEERCRTELPTGTCGIGHTRWATHGAPTDANAHPHTDCSGRIAVVHNGIIENCQELRAELEGAGHAFRSDTDTEVIAHVIEEELERATGDLVGAVISTCSRIRGSWALGVVCADMPGILVCARNGSPLVVATTNDGSYIASDVMPLAGITDHVTQLRDGEIAVLSPDGRMSVINGSGCVVDMPSTIDIDWDSSAAMLGGYADFMAKEIDEQPDAIERLLDGRLGEDGIRMDELSLSGEELSSIDHVVIVACGTSYHVGLVAKAAIRRWAHVPVSVEYASELNYDDGYIVSDHTLCVIITQSGETADTLSAARRMRRMGCKVFAITNVLGSTATREADGALYIQAGPEVAVASTKAYTAQMVAAFLLALRLAQANGTMNAAQVAAHYADICLLPDLMRVVLSRHAQAEQAAKLFDGRHSALFIGRDAGATTAYEGALKLKEISYLHAEAYPAGEMKHGPIALIDEGFPVVAIVPQDHVRDKVVSNMRECLARGASVIAVATDGDRQMAELADAVMWVPPCPDDILVPVVSVIHLQTLARCVALSRGHEVDKPRNLAKSVTVE